MAYVSLHGRAFGFDSDTRSLIRDGIEGGFGDHAVSSASTAVNITPRGTTTMSSAVKDYTMTAPITGVQKQLTTLTTSTGIRTVTLASGTFQSTAGSSWVKATFTGQGQQLSLQALSTALFQITQNIGVTLST